MSFNQLLGAFDLEITETASDCSASDYIQAALKSGTFLDLGLRHSILRDVSDILQCKAEDLTFLFETDIDEADASLLMVPSQRALLDIAVNDTAYTEAYRANDLAPFAEAAE